MSKVEPSLSQVYYVVLPLIRRAGQMLMTKQDDLADLNIKERHAQGKAIEEELQNFLATTIKQLFLDHIVYGIDKVPKSEKSTWQWVFTPLDGGRYYFRGLPLYTVAAALRKDGEVVIGMVYQPMVDKIFHAIKNEGAFLNDKKITVSDQKNWVGASAYVASLDEGAVALKKQQAAWTTLAKTGVHVHDLGVSSLGLCYLASGVFDIFYAVIESSSIMTQAAGLMIAREAGAIVTDGAGKTLGSGPKPTSLLVATPCLHRKTKTALGKKA